jgi:hypothetical protein
MHRYRSTAWRIAVAAVGLYLLNACTSFGSRTVPRDSFNYNEALAQSRNQQMLLNIVRLRYLDIPDFLAVSSVITSYTYQGDVGIQRTQTDNNSDLLPETLTGSANLSLCRKTDHHLCPTGRRGFLAPLAQADPRGRCLFAGTSRLAGGYTADDYHSAH